MSNAVSQAPTEQSNQQDQLAEQEIVHQVNVMIQYMLASNQKRKEIRHKSKTDTELTTYAML